VELLDGRILDISPIGPFHGGIVKRLSRLLTLEAKGRWILSNQDPLRLDEHSELEPDVMLLKPVADDYTNRHPAPEDVLLLIEVSDTTLEYDLQEKVPAYGHAGIAEVWIVNLKNGTIEVYREPHFAGYGSKAVMGASDQAMPQAFPDVTIPVGDLPKR
jgi:Uma2 family endonuclease